MANSIAFYQQQITQAYVANAATLGVTIDPTSWSATNIDRCVIYAVAVAAYILDGFFDLFKADVNETISLLKPHTLRWYAEKAKQFQYGFNLFGDTDTYNNTGVTEDDVLASKVVDYAAVVETQRGLRIKVAKDNGIDLEALTTPELDAFKFYMDRVKDAGVKLNITSAAADDLKSAITIIYNPLIINSQGQRIDGNSTTPVQSAINTFLKNLPFNGIFSVQKFVDAIQAVEGVTDLQITQISARYGTIPFANINVSYTPDSGYLRINQPTDLVLIFISE